MLDRTTREQRKAALGALREGTTYSPNTPPTTAKSSGCAYRAAGRTRVRTVYMGTSEFAVRVLRRLADSPHRPALVVAPPTGRGGRASHRAPAGRRRQLGAGLELLQTESVNRDDAD